MNRLPTTYYGAHIRINRIKGRAAEQTCQSCGKQAAEWSYDGTDPDEKTARLRNSTVTYSLDPDYYTPLCRSCHRTKDRHRNRGKTHCIRGHEFTPDNTYQVPSGSRSCIACRREAVRRCRARKAAA